MQRFRAFRIHQEGGKVAARLETIGLDDLGAGEVVVKVSHSTINYKDALAATGAGKILRKYPLVGGIDLAGEVVSSQHAAFEPGQKVLVNGCGLSETHDGGYAQYARVQGDWVVPIPAGLDEFQCMAIGTAGYTAALAIHRMEQNGQQPQGPDSGEIVVTGASGGVGSLAIDMLAGRGYRVVAVTGKKSSTAYLEQLGAARVLLRETINLGSRPLEEALWAGAIDNLGGDVLDVADAHDQVLGQHRQHRSRREPGAQDDGRAVHPARREPARHQLRVHTASAASCCVAAPRERPEAAPPGRYRHAHCHPGRAAAGVRAVRQRCGDGPGRRQDRLTCRSMS